MRALLVLLLFALLAGGLGLWYLRDDQAAPEPGDGGGGEPQPTGPQVVNTTPATLEVLLFDEAGHSLNEAQLTLTPLAGGAPRESVGPRTFEDIAPGAWRVEVRASGLWPHDATIQVAPGSEQREIVQLLDHMRVTGSVRTRFGEPYGQQPVWFLRPGEEHPTTAEAGRDLVRGQIDRDGRFEARLPAPGDWRLSVGAPGSALLVSDAASMRPGGPAEAEVVVGGVALLEVRAIDLPVRFQRGRGHFEVQILTRRARAAANDRGKDSWRTWHSQPYPQGAPLLFTNLPTEPTYGLGILSRMQGQYHGDKPFELLADARTIVTVSHPTREDDPETFVLQYEVEVQPLASDVAPPGVRWK